MVKWYMLRKPSSKIQEILNFINEKLGESPAVSDRIGTESWTWDGDSLALDYYGAGFSWDLCRHYSNLDEFKTARSDVQLLHEICHWICATHRNVPEFGLRRGVNMVDGQAWGPAGGQFRMQSGALNYWAINDFNLDENHGSDELLSFDEQMIQEYVTQRLSIMIGPMFNVSLEGLEIPEGCTWEKYEAIKQEEWGKPDGFKWPNEKNLARNRWFENNQANSMEAKVRFMEFSKKLSNNNSGTLSRAEQ